MPFKPGVSGNPKGRPPNERALTKIVERALSKTIDYGGKRTARKRVMAELLAQATTTGKVTFPDNTVMTFDGKEWTDFVMKLLNHIDGPAKSELDVNMRGAISVSGFEDALGQVYDDENSDDQS